VGVAKKAAVVWLGLLVGAGAACVPRIRPQGGVEVGVASWYGPDFHGRLTASREVFNMYDMTAAHPTLPLGTWVVVTHLDSGRSAVVRVNDRGPFARGRIIDLSYAAARLLGLVGPGTARVRVEVLTVPPGTEKGVRYTVQVGAFASPANAESLRQVLAPAFPSVYVEPFATPTQTFYRVRVRASGRAEAQDLATRLAAAGYPALLIEAP